MSFRANPRGCPRRTEQALMFPRSHVVLRGKCTVLDIVPDLVLQLCAICAERRSYRFTAPSVPGGLGEGIKRIERASGSEVEYHRGYDPSLTDSQRELSSRKRRLVAGLVDEGLEGATWAPFAAGGPYFGDGALS